LFVSGINALLTVKKLQNMLSNLKKQQHTKIGIVQKKSFGTYQLV